MKHRLFSFLNGMEMNKTEHEWLERRFDNMTAKEELLFRGAMLLERPMTMEKTIRILQGLDHYHLLYGADCDAKLGAFVMEHIHIPRPEARDYLALETVGAAYRAGGAGCFIQPRADAFGHFGGCDARLKLPFVALQCYLYHAFPLSSPL